MHNESRTITLPDGRWHLVDGIVTRGKRAASGLDACRHLKGTIRAQRPFFEERGIPLRGIFPGTINLYVAPLQVELCAPRAYLRNIDWARAGFRESFCFGDAYLARGVRLHRALVYQPDPDTKHGGQTPPSTLELLCAFIPGIRYGDPLTMLLNARQYRIA